MTEYVCREWVFRQVSGHRVCVVQVGDWSPGMSGYRVGDEFDFWPCSECRLEPGAIFMKVRG